MCRNWVESVADASRINPHSSHWVSIRKNATSGNNYTHDSIDWYN